MKSSIVVVSSVDRAAISLVVMKSSIVAESRRVLMDDFAPIKSCNVTESHLAPSDKLIEAFANIISSISIESSIVRLTISTAVIESLIVAESDIE